MLSDRIRPDVEAAPWVIEEIKKLEAENAKLKQVLIDIAYGLESSRIWGGMEWAYNPLHPFKYLPLRDAARAVLGETK